MIKKITGLVLAAALVIAQIAAPVNRAYAENQKVAPAYAGGIRHQNLQFYGSKPCIITASTTAVLCASGEGFLDAICPYGGLFGSYTLGLDTPTAGTRSVTNSDGYVITPPVRSSIAEYAVSGQYSLVTPQVPGCFALPNGPVRFVNGLVGVQSAAGGSSVIYWHSSSGSNP